MNLNIFSIRAFLALLVFTLLSCTKKPEACMSFSKEQPEVGKIINFTNCSGNAESVTWRFGDGNITDTENPQYTYRKTGDYNLDLLAYSKNFKYQDKTSAQLNVLERKIIQVVLIDYPGSTVDLVIKGGNNQNAYTYESAVYGSPSLPVEEDMSSANIRASLKNFAVGFFEENVAVGYFNVKVSEAAESPVIVKYPGWHFEVHYELAY